MKNYNKIHFVGACGVSMSGIIKHLIKEGKTVSGSDSCVGNVGEELTKIGAKIHSKHTGKNAKNADLVVFSSAVDKENPELVYAQKHKIPVLKRSEILGEIISSYATSIAVSGSHGKTTSTAMISNVLISAGKDPTVFLGGDDYNFGNYRSGEKSYAVVEACEYKKNFLDIKPNVAVVLNIDNDHLDTYKSMTELVDAFSSFTNNALAVVNVDDVFASRIFNSATVTFGIKQNVTYTAKSLHFNGIGYDFVACIHGRPVGKIKLKVFGKHNVYNALSAIAVCDVLRIPFGIIKSSLENFNGVKRRNEYIGEFHGMKCFADYAHHPKEINATLTAFLENGEDYVTVFQPHTYSRTKILMNEFINVLKDRKPLIIYKTYAARESFDVEGSAKTLFEKICLASGENCVYVESEKDLSCELQKLAKQFKRVVFLGAGDVYEKAKNIIVQK